MNYTENLELKKPEQDEYYNVDDFNYNADKLDEAVSSIKMDVDNNVVHKTGDETIGGNKNFNDSITVNGVSNLSSVEFKGDTNHGGYLDFHFNKSEQDHTSRIIEDESGRIHIIGVNGMLCDGTIKVSNNNALFKASDDGYNLVCGASEWGKGSGLLLSGKDNGYAGCFHLVSNNGSDSSELVGYPDGGLQWKNKNIVRSVNGLEADNNGNIDLTKLTNGSGEQLVYAYYQTAGWGTNTPVVGQVYDSNDLYYNGDDDLSSSSASHPADGMYECVTANTSTAVGYQGGSGGGVKIVDGSKSVFKWSSSK
jgi:hypothetical protein